MQINLKPPILLFLGIVAARLSAMSPIIEPLPPTQREARLQLEDATLDSSLWELVRDFYDEPLVVPLGELRYLQDILAEHTIAPIVSQKSLARYEPWDASAIERFFKDNPQLEPFRPILSFETRHMPRLGTVGFRSSTKSVSAQPRHSARFAIAPVKAARIEGLVEFENNYARWQRRRLLFRMGKRAKLQAGNFSSRFTNGLAYGYFPGAGRSLAYITDNWLFGNSRTWNGVECFMQPAQVVSISALLHHRPTESVLGAETELIPLKFLRVWCGFSASEITDTTHSHDTLLATHAGLQLKIEKWRLKIFSASNLKNASALPVVVSADRAYKGSRIEVHALKIPRLYYAPRSRIVHDAWHALDYSDSVSEDITGFGAGFAGPLPFDLSHVYRIRYLIGETVSCLQSSFGLSGRAPLDWRIRYYFYPLSSEESARHSAYLYCARPLNSKLKLSSRLSYYARQYKYHRTKIDFDADIAALPAVSVMPGAAYSVNSRKEHDVVIQLGQRLMLFEKTFGELTVRVPVMKFRDEGIEVHARSSFLF